jgi:hypothetical protein
MDKDNAIRMRESDARLVHRQCARAYSKRGLVPPAERVVKPTSAIRSGVTPDSIF